jgi:CDP-diacylglycerol--serine O-phosphatidyltransferase
MIGKPQLLESTEKKISAKLPENIFILPTVRLAVSIPILIIPFVKSIQAYPWIAVTTLLLFGIIDYFDGTSEKKRVNNKRTARLFHRITELPVLLILSYLTLTIISPILLAAKVLLDVISIIITAAGKEDPDHSIRTGINFITLLSMLIIAFNLQDEIITPKLTTYLLIINIVYTAVVALYNMRILQKRFIADALSGVNLLCGIFSMVFASSGRFGISLLLLMIGAAFDGFDGAAARKFGGTRLGVYSDDVADGVNYGIAPGVALYFAIGGIEGLVAGMLFSTFTLSRLVYFTLNKSYSDPNFFSGVPSTVGGIITLCSIILFREMPSLTGLMVGIACMQMVSFDTHYRHLGRALSSNRRIIYGMPVLIILLVVGKYLVGVNGPVAIILGVSLLYGFLPTISHFLSLIRKKSDNPCMNE